MEWVYFPLFPVWMYLAIKARSLFFFSAANPGIRNGGLAMESKQEIYKLMPAGTYPKTVFVEEHVSSEEIIKLIENAGISYPLIAKPDIGMKALGVEKLHSPDEIQGYIKRFPGDKLFQEFIDFPLEIGIFYYRYPDQKQGKISGMVFKDFLTVIGTGKLTLEALIKLNPRSHLQLGALKKKFGARMFEILPEGETVVLMPFGSHTRGAKFLDISSQVSTKLEFVIDSIAGKTRGFYFGRLDIRYVSFDLLEEGKDFSIIEINGSGSEPTHMYDPRHSFFYAWKEIIRHWNILCKISIANHKRGVPYLSLSKGFALLEDGKNLDHSLKKIHFK